MKSIFSACKKFWFLSVTLLVLSFSIMASDQVVASSVVPPELIGGVLSFLVSIPKIGPIITMIFSWVGFVGAAFTALAVCAETILKIPELTAKYAGAEKLEKQIIEISKKVTYYLKFFSIFNASNK